MRNILFAVVTLAGLVGGTAAMADDFSSYNQQQTMANMRACQVAIADDFLRLQRVGRRCRTRSAGGRVSDSRSYRAEQPPQSRPSIKATVYTRVRRQGKGDVACSLSRQQ